MIRGTTAKFEFDLPCNFADLTDATIYFWQKHYYGTEGHPLPIMKSLEDCNQTANPNQLAVVLNENETLGFTESEKGYLQLWAKTNDYSFARKEEMFSVFPQSGTEYLICTAYNVVIEKRRK